MKKQVILSILIVALVTILVPAYAEENNQKILLTKNEAVELALKQNRELDNFEENLKKSQARLKQAKASFYPKVDLTTVYTKLNGPSISQPLFNNDGTAILDSNGIQKSMQFDLDTQDNYSFKLGFQQPLYLGGKLKNSYKQGEKGVEISKLQLEDKKQVLREKVIEEYYNVLKAKKMVALTEQSLKKIEEYLQIAKVNRKIGIFTNTDVLRAKLDFNRIQQALLKSKNGLKLAKLSLKNTLNLDSSADIEVAEKLDWKEVEVNFNQIKDYAFEHRVDLNILNLQKDIGELNVDTANKDRYPSLNLTGDYGTNGSKFEIDDGDWKVNLILSYNLFDGGAKESKVIEAKSEVNQIENNIEILKDGIELQIKQGILKLDEAKKSIELAELSLEEGKNNLKETEIKFKEGIVASFDVLDAQTAYEEVQINYYEAIYNYNLALANLDKIKGKEIKY